MRPDEQRLREELAAHLEELAADYERQGLSPEAARRTARLKLGGEDQIRMLWRDARRWSWLEHWARDLRLALRSLRRSPGYAAAVIITLAVAIGANTAMFSVADAFLLRPLPYAQPQRLVIVMARVSSASEFPLSGPMFRAWRDRNRSFTALAAFHNAGGVLTGRGLASELSGTAVSASLLSLLGVHAAVGRFFLPAEDNPYADGGTDAIVISHKLFESRFNGQPSAIGSLLHMSGKAYTLVGVAPAGFNFPPGNSRDFWITTATFAELLPGWKTPKDQRWGTMYLAAVGRLRPGLTVAPQLGI
ncbi:MAG: ABC transporter permease [Terriglobales bacterium]